MRWCRSVMAVTVLLLTACPEPDPSDPTPSPTPDGSPTPAPATPTPSPTPEPGDDDDTSSPPASPTPDPRLCSPALTLEPTDATVAPLALLTLKATGGTGEYRFDLVQNESGGAVNELTGAYLAGPETEATDIVQVIDLGCEGSASASLHVPGELTVAPTDAEVAPGVAFQFDIRGGSDQFRCNILTNGSGAVLDSRSCLYTAGSGDGLDVVRVIDVETGLFIDAYVLVKTGAVLKPSPRNVFLPVDSRFTLAIEGGSGVFDLEGTGEAVELDGYEAWATTPGRESISARDRFTGLTTGFTLTAVEAQATAGLVRTGERTANGTALTPGDLDGDGYLDVLLAVPDVDVDAANGGAVYLYRGGADGIERDPVQVIAGKVWDDNFGTDIAVADFDGDELPDLAVGAWKVDGAGSDRGAVYLYPGLPDGTFHGEPSITLPGRSDGDNLGNALTACDFNGDGFPDLAASAWNEEDNTRSPTPSDQGAIYLYAGGADGLTSSPVQILYGRTLNSEGAWIDQKGMHLAAALASGDVNGDGLCDLVAGTHEFDTNPANNTNDGAVFVHLGQDGDPALLTTADPVAAWTPVAEGGNGSTFGRTLAVGDLDGDGIDDLLVGQPRHRPQPANNSQNGGVRLYLGAALEATPATAFLPAEAADWSAEADAKDDLFGWTVRMGDADGDGLLDLIAGNIQDEVSNGVGNAGTVVYFKGVADGLPATTPSRVFSGLHGGDYFGQGFTLVDDLDGDRKPDFFVYASRDDTLGWDVGTPYYVLTRFDVALESLEMPGSPAGQRLSPAAVVGDINGDGRADLVVGAPYADISGNQFDGGGVWLYLGTADGFDTTPALTLVPPANYNESDQVGWAVAPAGDFNKDGAADFAVLVRGDDRPSSFSASEYANPTECAGEVKDSGAVLIYLGRKDGTPSSRPAFVWYGSQASNNIQALAGGFDYDNDGFDDLLVGAPLWNRSASDNVGGVAFLRGRAAAVSGLTQVICQSDYDFVGLLANDRVGESVAVLGDLDGDGCDEVAAGGSQEDLGNSDQGSVRVFFGWGSKCRKTSLEAVVLKSGAGKAQAGISVAGGGDVDGDGLPDLAVGGPALSVDGATVGGAWVVTGAYLETLVREAVKDNTAPANVYPFASGEGVFRVEGGLANAQCGKAVALVPGLSGDNRAGLAMGCPQSDIPGVANAGGVRLYRFRSGSGDDLGLDPEPLGAFGGETDPTGGLLGDALAAGMLNGKPVLAVGGQRGDGAGPDVGAVYVLPMDGVVF